MSSISVAVIKFNILGEFQGTVQDSLTYRYVYYRWTVNTSLFS